MNKFVAVATGLLALGPARADEDALQRCRAIADPAPRLACYDAIAIRPATPPTAIERFGKPAEPNPIERVETRIEGRFEGWGPRQRIRLANGQVWQVNDDSRGVYWLESPRVVVRRGALGSYVLEIDGVNALVRVRRVE